LQGTAREEEENSLYKIAHCPFKLDRFCREREERRERRERILSNTKENAIRYR
jgi:hypothetical protein